MGVNVSEILSSSYISFLTNGNVIYRNPFLLEIGVMLTLKLENIAIEEQAGMILACMHKSSVILQEDHKT